MSRSFSQIRLIALWLALLGTGLRALLPVGFMPMADHSGGVALVFCSGQGLQSVHRDDSHQPVKSSSTQAEQCPFGFALSMGVAPSALVSFGLERSAPVSSAQPPVSAGAIVVPGWYSSRGPPSYT